MPSCATSYRFIGGLGTPTPKRSRDDQKPGAAVGAMPTGPALAPPVAPVVSGLVGATGWPGGGAVGTRRSIGVGSGIASGAGGALAGAAGDTPPTRL
jgi:hypothetical protein